MPAPAPPAGRQPVSRRGGSAPPKGPRPTQAHTRQPRPQRSSPVALASKEELQAKLNITRILHLAGDLPEARRAGDIASGRPPTYMIQRIEELAAELEVFR